MSPVRVFGADEIRARADEFGAVLLDCVQGGASVSFMADLTGAEAEGFFRRAADAVASGERALVAAEQEGRIVGTVQLITAMPANQPHRADIAKLLVRRSARGAGWGRALMIAVEDEARRAGKTLLCLDTADAAAERIYTRLDYRRAGTIPGYALYPDGRPCDTVLFYKTLERGVLAEQD